MDLLIDDDEYRTTVERLQAKMAGLVLPNSPHIVRAGEYLQNLGLLWSEATIEEQRDITRVLVKAVYVDVLQACIVALEPMPLFRPLFSEFCGDIGVAIL